MIKNDFTITALSDHQGLGDLVTILGGTVGLLSQLFPSIFGGARKELTTADWMQIIPGNGYYTSQLRNYLQGRIRYDVDFTKWAKTYTMDWLYPKRFEICQTIPESCWRYTPANVPGGGYECAQCFQVLNQVLQTEKLSGGSQPIGNIPGYTAGIDFTKLLPIALAVGGILLLSRKKK